MNYANALSTKIVHDFFLFWRLCLQHTINNWEVQKGMFRSFKYQHYHRNQCSGHFMHYSSH